jgi:hypothetical protein
MPKCTNDFIMNTAVTKHVVTSCSSGLLKSFEQNWIKSTYEVLHDHQSVHIRVITNELYIIT